MSMGRRIVADSLKGKSLKRKSASEDALTLLRDLIDADVLSTDQTGTVAHAISAIQSNELPDAIDMLTTLGYDVQSGSRAQDVLLEVIELLDSVANPDTDTEKSAGVGAGLKRKSDDTDFTDEMYKVLEKLGSAMGMADRALTKAVDADMGDISTEADALSAVLNRLDSLEEFGQLPSRDDVQEFLDALGDLLNQADAIPAQAGVDLGNAHSRVEDVLSDWDTIEDGGEGGGDSGGGGMQDPRGTGWGSASAARLRRKAVGDGYVVEVTVEISDDFDEDDFVADVDDLANEYNGSADEASVEVEEKWASISVGFDDTNDGQGDVDAFISAVQQGDLVGYTPTGTPQIVKSAGALDTKAMKQKSAASVASAWGDVLEDVADIAGSLNAGESVLNDMDAAIAAEDWPEVYSLANSIILDVQDTDQALADRVQKVVDAAWEENKEKSTGRALDTKTMKTKRSPFTRQERSESGITESLDHVLACADAASHFWTSGDPEETMSALDDLIAEAKAAKQRIANHGESYPPEVEEPEVIAEASARKARIEERSGHVKQAGTSALRTKSGTVFDELIADIESELKENDDTGYLAVLEVVKEQIDVEDFAGAASTLSELLQRYDVQDFMDMLDDYAGNGRN